MEDVKTNGSSTKTAAENLTEHVADYIETSIKLAVVHATQKTTDLATTSLAAVWLSFFCTFALLFSGIAFAIWIGEASGNMKVGYFCVAGFYLLGALLFILFRKKVIFPYVRDQIIRKVYE